MKRIWAQCIKELVQFSRDRIIVALAFLLPLSTFLIYSFAIRLEVKNIPFAIQDFELSIISRAYIESIFASNQFQPVPWFGNDLVHDTIDRGIAKAALVIPPDFSRRIKSKSNSSSVQVLVDGTDVNNARVIKNTINAITNSFIQKMKLETETNRLVAQKRIWFNPGRKESLYIVPGAYAIVLWIYPSLLTAIAMSREKEQGTIIQVYASGISPREFLLGKTLAYFFVALSEAVFIMSLGIIMFKIWFVGDPTPFLISTPIFLVTSILFGLLIGVRSANQSEAVQKVAAPSILTSFLLSGFIYSLNNIPFPLSLTTYIIPVRYYIEISRDTFIRGTGWTAVWYVPLVLTLLSSILFLSTLRNLRNMQIDN